MNNVFVLAKLISVIIILAVSVLINIKFNKKYKNKLSDTSEEKFYNTIELYINYNIIEVKVE